MLSRTHEKGPKNYEIFEEDIDMPYSLLKKLRAARNAFTLHDEDEK